MKKTPILLILALALAPSANAFGKHKPKPKPSPSPKVSVTPSPAPSPSPSPVPPTTTTSTTSTSTSTSSTTTTTVPPVVSTGWTMCPNLVAGAGEPALPKVCVDTTMPKVTGKTLSVTAGDAADLQAKINAALPGDEVVIPAGSTYSGNFTLPKKTGDGWVVIRTSRISEIPAERNRISVSNIVAMPKLQTPNLSPVLTTAYGAHHYRLVGIEFGIASGVGLPATGNSVTNLIALGTTYETSLDQLPHHLIVDRCYIHGNKDGNMRRGIGLNAGEAAVVDSIITDAHEVGTDSQAIAGWNGAGPYKIVNNVLEGAAENFLLGGGDPSITNLVVGDVEVRKNFIHKPFTWKQGDAAYGGTHWQVKNLLELKAVRRILIEGNVLDGSWPDGQVGFAFVVKTANQDGKCTQCETVDVTIRNNHVRNTLSGAAISGLDNAANVTGGNTERVTFENNWFEFLPGSSIMFQIHPGLPNLHFVNNTGFPTQHFLSMTDATGGLPTFKFNANLVAAGEYGLHSPGGMNQAALDLFFGAGKYEASKNVVVTGPSYRNWGDNVVLAAIPTLPYAGGGADMNKLKEAVKGVE